MKTVKVHNEVPFASSISFWIQLHDMDFQTMERNSHRYDPHYLAWQTVRKKRNPFFSNGTGFEGYFVSIAQTPDAALAQILAIGHRMLNSIIMLHRHDYRFRSNLMKTLVGEQGDFKSVYKWNALFGAALARLRCQVRQDRVATAFRDETYQLVEQLPGINYPRDPNTVTQEYYIVGDMTHFGRKLTVSNNWLNPSDQDAWLVMQSVGRFGHPLVRAYLRQKSRRRVIMPRKGMPPAN
jgi:hypothetical protein